jgi:hypothetical protein
VTFLDREAVSADALLTDLYLDALLAGIVADAADAARNGGPAPDAQAGLDPAVRAASDRLRRDLVRVHPSFRFEERLATRLAETALAMRVQAAAGAEAGPIPFRPAGLADPFGDDDPAADPDRRDRSRPLLIGGALTSAALSIAGAAYVAWRRWPGRGSTPMARAARAVRDAHDATRAADRDHRGRRSSRAGRPN